MQNEPLNPRTKYLRKIRTNRDGLSDVYDVLKAFDVTNPAIAHAAKKLLCGGLRGKGSRIQDYKEAMIALERGIQLEEEEAENPGFRGYTSSEIAKIFSKDSDKYIGAVDIPGFAGTGNYKEPEWTEDDTHWTDMGTGNRYIRDLPCVTDKMHKFPECGKCAFRDSPMEHKHPKCADCDNNDLVWREA